MLSKGSMTRAGFVSVPISKPPMMMMISVNSSSSMSQTIQRAFPECFTFAIEIKQNKEGLWGATHRNEFLLWQKLCFSFFLARRIPFVAFLFLLLFGRVCHYSHKKEESLVRWMALENFRKKKKIREFFKLDTKKEMTKSTNWNSSQEWLYGGRGGDTHTHTHNSLSLSTCI